MEITQYHLEKIKEVKMNFLKDNSMLTPKQMEEVKLVPDEIDRDAFVTLKKIQDNIKEFADLGRNLLIKSSITGNGKTAWSIKLMLAYFEEIWLETDFEPKAFFLHVPTMFNKLRENISERNEYTAFVRENIEKADIIVWDEIGVKDLSAFESYNFLSYIDRRINLGKANIFTTNLEEEQLLQGLGDRLYSRIVENSKIIELKGPDKRRINKW